MLQSTNKVCSLQLPQLPKQAQEAHIIPGLTHSIPLLSIGKLCDAGCKATFNKHEVRILKNNQELFKGQRDQQTGLWRIPITNPTSRSPTPHQTKTKLCNIAYQIIKIPELIQFLHAAAFSPVPSTWIKAIQRDFFQSWPGLTTEAVHKHLPKSMATTKGHMDQTRKI
jgi:hypothetical protein